MRLAGAYASTRSTPASPSKTWHVYAAPRTAWHGKTRFLRSQGKAFGLSGAKAPSGVPWQGVAGLRLAPLGRAWWGNARQGLFSAALASKGAIAGANAPMRQGEARCAWARHGRARQGPAWHGKGFFQRVRHREVSFPVRMHRLDSGPAWHGMAGRDVAGWGRERPGKPRRGKARQDNGCSQRAPQRAAVPGANAPTLRAWQGLARPGRAWLGEARPGRATQDKGCECSGLDRLRSLPVRLHQHDRSRRRLTAQRTTPRGKNHQRKDHDRNHR